ncbi:MAG: four helix bundle protein [Aequorivita sp.]
MATIEKFEDLDIWKEVLLLSKEIILLSKNTELRGDYRLKDQVKGSSGSVMDNIAEGFERDGNLKFKQFYYLFKQK